MKIDRSNYEIWFIDWLEGNLDTFQAERLNLFLNENPDLKEELNGLNLATVEPFNRPFSRKELMKKLPSDITLNQFEYLCAAFLENDLTSDQKSELLQIVASDAGKKRSFDLIQRSRLAAVPVSFRHKNRLFRRTTKAKIIRLSVIGLSAAAAVTLIITTYLTPPGNINSDINNFSVTGNAEANIPHQPSEITPGTVTEEVKVLPGNKKSIKVLAVVRKQTMDAANSESVSSMPVDSMIINTSPREPAIERIKINTQISFKEEISSGKLVASATVMIIPEKDEERNSISRFISKTFREKILKEEPSPDRPLKGYEIAEAGVTGLNKILGWEMALNRNSDDKGELKSVYFSSRIVKFTAPVKKSEPLP